MRLAPSLHRIGTDMVNVYLVEDETGVTVIDAGVAGMWQELLDELALMGRSIDDVRAVLLTHGDTDHVGFAERARVEHGVEVYVHGDDAARAAGEVKKPNTGWGPVRIGALAGFLWYTARKGGFRTRPVTTVRPLVDGQTLALPGNPRIIHIPGHTPGSVAIHVPAVEAVFVGDAMTTRNVLTGEKGPRPAPFTLEPDQALGSLSRLDGIEARFALPGHGPPWDGGLAEALARYRLAAAD